MGNLVPRRTEPSTRIEARIGPEACCPSQASSQVGGQINEKHEKTKAMKAKKSKKISMKIKKKPLHGMAKNHWKLVR